MREAGNMLAAGPLTDQEDEHLRGVCLYRTGLDETRALVQQDPMVIARRLTADAMTWWTRRGVLAFPLER